MFQSKQTAWDVRVVSALDLSVKAYVPRWSSIEFSDQLSDVGSGKISLDYKDSFFADFDTTYSPSSLFDGSYAIQILRSGTAVFTFLIEDVDTTRIGSVESITIAGRGIGAQLEWAVALPEGFSPASKTTNILGVPPTLYDREFKSYEFLVKGATTTNLASSYLNDPILNVGKLTASSNGSINSLSIDGITDWSISDTILVKNQSKPAENGIYRISVLGDASTPWELVRVTNLAIYDERYCYVGAKVFVLEGTASAQKAYDITACPSATSGFGSDPITFALSSVVYTGVSAFYLLFKEADTGNELIATRGVNFGTTRTGYGRGGTLNKVSWGLSLDSTLSSGKGLTDSKGALPKDAGLFVINKGKTLLESINTVCQQTECDWHVSPTGVISICRTPNASYAVPFGTDRTTGASAMLFTLPSATTAETKTSTRATRSVVYGTNGYLIDTAVSTAVSNVIGRRESYIENSSDDAPAVANIASTALNKIAGAKLEVSVAFVEKDDQQAWLDFQIGDKVLVEVTIGSYQERIISGISASVDNNSNVSIELSFEEVIPDSVTSLQNQSIYGSAQAAEFRSFFNNGRSKVQAASVNSDPAPVVSGMSSAVTLAWDSNTNSNASGYDAFVYKTSGMHQVTTAARVSNVATITTADPHGLEVGDYAVLSDVPGFNGSYIVVSVPSTPKIPDDATGQPTTFTIVSSGADTYGSVIGGKLDGFIYLTAVSRKNNIVSATTARNHSFVVGDSIIVSDTGYPEFDTFNTHVYSVPDLNTITYENYGPDLTPTLTGVPRIKKITEIHSVRAAANQTSATIENLASSDRPYEGVIIPVNQEGLYGEPSAAVQFFSSADDMVVIGGAIKSPNYVSGSTGWRIAGDGLAEFSGVTVRGAIYASTGTFTGSITGSEIYIPNNISPQFSVTSAGSMTSTSGSIAGWTITSSYLGAGVMKLYSAGYINMTSGNYEVNINSFGFSGKRNDGTRWTVHEILPSQVRTTDYLAGYSISDTNIEKTFTVQPGNIFMWHRTSTSYANATVFSTQSLTSGGYVYSNLNIYRKDSADNASSSISLDGYSGNISHSGYLSTGSYASISGDINGYRGFYLNTSYAPSNFPVFQVASSRSSGSSNNFPTAIFENTYGNHSWGIVAEFRINGSGDRPSILFSSGAASRTWSIGYGYTDDDFRIRINHGFYYSGWGTTSMRWTVGTNSTPRVIVSGATDALPSDGTLVVNGASGYYAAMSVRMNSTGGDNYVVFYNGNNTQIGLIYSPSGTTTTYGTSSDYRLKENINDISSGLSVINQLRPRTFNFKSNPEKNMAGFIAHEVSETIPDAVFGEKDATNPETGEIVPQQLDVASFSPYLVKAIQELSARIESLEAQLAN